MVETVPVTCAGLKRPVFERSIRRTEIRSVPDIGTKVKHVFVTVCMTVSDRPHIVLTHSSHGLPEPIRSTALTVAMFGKPRVKEAGTDGPCDLGGRGGGETEEGWKGGFAL